MCSTPKAPEIDYSDAFTKTFIGRAVINQPSDAEYAALDGQLAALTGYIQNQLYNPKTPYNRSLKGLEKAQSTLQKRLAGIERLQVKWANNQYLMQQQARQMLTLMGPPPPEKAAESVVIGQDSTPWHQRGKQALVVSAGETGGLAI